MKSLEFCVWGACVKANVQSIQNVSDFFHISVWFTGWMQEQINYHEQLSKNQAAWKKGIFIEINFVWEGGGQQTSDRSDNVCS